MDAFLIKRNKKLLKKLKSLDLLLLLYAFLYGNLFAIHNSRLNWNLLLIFFIVFFLEFISKTIYFIRDKELKIKSNFNKDSLVKSKLQPIFQRLHEREESKQNENYSCIIINTLKRGFLLGFFLEAFKVGS